MDQLRKIEILVSVADAGSFSGAARTLLLSPSAVSHAVAQLEQELGARLFYRTTRQVRLTAQGEDVVQRGRDVLKLMTELSSSVRKDRDRVAGDLRVGIPPGVSRHIVMPHIASFMRQFPDLRLQVINTGSNTGSVRDMYLSGADIHVRVGELPDSSLVSRSLATFRFGVYASPEYLKVQGTPLHPRELLQHRCLVHKVPRSATLAPWNQWDYLLGDERGTITVPATFATDDREALLVAAVAGAGLFRIGMFTPELIESGQLVRVLTEWHWPGGPKLSVMYRKQSPQPRRIVAFIDFMMETIRAFDPLEYTLVHRPSASRGARR